MVSVTFLKVCCQSDVSFSCRRCSYSGLVDYILYLKYIFFQLLFTCLDIAFRIYTVVTGLFNSPDAKIKLVWGSPGLFRGTDRKVSANKQTKSWRGLGRGRNTFDMQ